MSRLILSLSLLPLLAALAPVAIADETHPETCDDTKSDGCPPKSFSVVELPDGQGTQVLATGEGFLLHSECRSSKTRLSCSGWPQETGSGGNLKYEWSFESSERRVSYPRGDVFARSVECEGGERIVATLTISNGRYKVSASETYTCGVGS
jgi:hypothetical protein